MYSRSHSIKLVIVVHHIVGFHIFQGKSEPHSFLSFVIQYLVEQLIKNALALVKGCFYLFIVGSVGHMLQNEEQVITILLVCTQITTIAKA